MLVFTLLGDQLRQKRDFWCLMFFVLFIAVMAAYAVLTYLSSHLAVVCADLFNIVHGVNAMRSSSPPFIATSISEIFSARV
jgi:hypothetical protein